MARVVQLYLDKVRRAFGLFLACALFPIALLCSACGTAQPTPDQQGSNGPEPDTSNFLIAVDDKPDTVDFQCTTINYTIATNVFNRLVETELQENGEAKIVPSLAEWEESADGREYTFHLRKDVKFSNGSPLTSSDVLYSFTRLLTHPDSNNQDIVEPILGAKRLKAGEATELEGFKIIDDLNFTITLEQPFEAFLACLSTPGASIMDEETTEKVGDDFGKKPEATIGTGPLILSEWDPERGMLLTANKDCWSGPAKCAGVDLRFLTEPEEIRKRFESNDLDILDLDDLGSSAEFYIHGDIYQGRIHEVPRTAIAYIALNESVEPLGDVRVRKALQLALNRPMLLEAIYSGRGNVENGIYPYGLYGHNQSLPEIPYDPDGARQLLQEAGRADGFDLTFAVKSSSTQWEMALANYAVSMWGEIGVRAKVKVLDEDEFMKLRKSGELPCYTATWTADFNDPDNFVYTFFGTPGNSTFRSLNYSNEVVMSRVRAARGITDPVARLREYQDLERIIVQEDAAWIPLFSRRHLYVASERLEGFRYMWNGSVKSMFYSMSIKPTS